MDKNSFKRNPYVRRLKDVGYDDIGQVGGKSASLGEMLSGLSSSGVRVPDGFSTTVDAYGCFIKENDLEESIDAILRQYRGKQLKLRQAGKGIRDLMLKSVFPEKVAAAIRSAFQHLSAQYGADSLAVAVRSSATSEDQPGASFAGMLDTYLNVQGETDLLSACRRCFASLFTDRAIRYRERMGIDDMNSSLCVAVQRMIRSEKAGVMFSIDKETGFPDMVMMTASWGLGESDVAGETVPDEYRVYKLFLGGQGGNPIVEKHFGVKQKKYVFKAGGGIEAKPTTHEERHTPVLSDDEILKLGRWAVLIEDYYGRPMDMEWAGDGDSGALFMTQARPITDSFKRDAGLSFCRLEERGRKILTGVSIGEGIARGKVFLIRNFQEIDRLTDDTILVSEQANTAWVGDLQEKKVKALVTDFGSRNSHAALICRELGIPGVVGTLTATEDLVHGQEVTVQSIEGDHGFVYEGAVEYAEETYHLRDVPYTDLNVMINIAGDAAAFQWWRLPCRGVGLVRMDYIYQNVIKIHPLAAIHSDKQLNRNEKYRVEALTRGYETPRDYFVDRLTACLAKIAASRLPDPVVVRPTNFESQEYRELIGGVQFEKAMDSVGPDLRGACRYLSEPYGEAFSLECEAFRRVRQEHGFNNLHLMIPYCEHPAQARAVLGFLEAEGLKRGNDGFQVYLCCDYAANWLFAQDFAGLFDGFSLDVRKLQRWVRSTGAGAGEAGKTMEKALEKMLEACHDAGGTVTVRGRLLAHASALVSLLVAVGVDAVSVNPEAIPRVMKWIVDAEK
ncbi:MAG: phosphoenolpyruvate synthase [Deltaproteobacteria bacterium]|nr:phosphoenolpyruvate synthase [Deltaproteobacteria bacterium]